MIVWMVFFWLGFAAFFALHTRKLPVLRMGLLGYLWTSILLAILCGIAVQGAVDSFEKNIFQSLFALQLTVFMVAFELLFFLQGIDRFVRRYKQLLMMLEQHRKGLLLQMPFRQGEQLYWIDNQSIRPQVRRMYFVVAVSDCYIGVYEDKKRLVSVHQIFLDRREAKRMLDSYYFASPEQTFR